MGSDIDPSQQVSKWHEGVTEALLAAIVENTDDAIVGKTLRGIVTFWNPGAERIFGYSAAEMIGQSITKIIPAERADEEPRILATLARGERIRHYESQRQTKDGRLIDVSITASPIRNKAGEIIGASKVARDITVQKEDENELRKSEQRYRSLFENNLDPIFSLDSVGKFHSANPASLTLSGFSIAELRESHFLELTAPDCREQAVNAFREGLCRKCSDFEMAMVRKDGTRIALFVTGAPVVVDGEVVGVSCIARDITERKKTMDELVRSQQEAEAANKAKDNFLSALSHELRTPLTPVLMMISDYEEDKTLPEELRESMGIARRNIEVEIRLIDDLLDLTRVKHGKLELRFERMDLHDLLRQAIPVVTTGIKPPQRIPVLEFHAASHHASVDRIRIQQVFWNLLRNAYKFSAETTPIVVTTSNPSPETIRIDIKDCGIGIRAEMLDRIFLAFEQDIGDAGTRRGGLGLGLSLSKAIVDMHGGSIEAASDGVGKGSVFSVELSTSSRALRSDRQN